MRAIAKTDRVSGTTRSLIGHSLDVAYAARAMLQQGAGRDRLSAAARRCWASAMLRFRSSSAITPALYILRTRSASACANCAASSASLLPGDILLGADQKPFTSVGDLWTILQGVGPRQVRLEFLRGDYSRVRGVTAQLGVENASRSHVAA